MNLINQSTTNSINFNNIPDVIHNTTASTSSHDYINPPDSSSLPSRYLNLKVGSLNCRGLTKTAAPSTRSHFIRYLKDRGLDLLALQETHASTTEIKEMFHIQFQASSSIWSSHCGLVSFSSDILFSNSFISPCERVISTTVSHTSDLFLPLTVSVVYFPASRAERYTFLTDIQQKYPLIFPSSPTRTILLGDFNYTYGHSLSTTRSRQAPSHWLAYTDNHFVDGITPSGTFPSNTFQRGVSQSCIDYIFISTDLFSSIDFDDCSTTFIQPIWSDHFLLTTHLRLHQPTGTDSTAKSVGKGLWRAHPKLARNPDFKKRLNLALTEGVAALDPSLSAAIKWERLKLITADICRAFSRRKAFNLKRAEDLLHKKRSGLRKKLISNPASLSILSPQLKIVEQQLISIQQYRVETLALRSGIRWREFGELSAGYLKRTVASRAARQLIPPLIHPESLSPCTTKEEMLETASFFYNDLYSPEPVDMTSLDTLLERLPESLRLSSSEAESLVAPITMDDLLFAFSRCPKKSSPGMDGLPYAILRLVISHPSCREIVLATYNNALSLSDIPTTWMQSCV
ncbi:Endonuclease/exonuclease/phosphatase, partial [Pilaira anomala]